jgi:tetratricopeptide (TPR) repeat protein
MHATTKIQNLSDRTLNRATRILALVLIVGIPLIGIVYWLDRHPDAGPSLVDRTVAAAEEAVKNAPGDLAARDHLGAAYVSAKRYADGIATFTDVLRASPTDRPALLGRGLAYVANAEPAEATKDFQAIVDSSKSGEFAATDPQLEQAYYELGVIALQQGNGPAAVTQLEAALAIDGGDADALYSFGMALIANGDPTKGVEALRHAVAFVPSGWCEPYNGLVSGYAALNDPVGGRYATGMVAFCGHRSAEAIAALKPLVGGPMSTDALLGLALNAAQDSDTASAVAYYRQVLATDPKNTSALIGLSQLDTSGLPGSSQPASTPPSSPAPEGT